MSLPRIVVWEPDEEGLRGTDLVRLNRAGNGYRADGVVAAVEGDHAWGVRFSVVIDAAWRTREVELQAISADGVRVRRLSCDAEARWRVDGEPEPALDGCLDVDLEATPFTNTLAIRRLELAVGGEAEICTAWVGVRDLEVRTSRQSYRRLSIDTYLYRSLDRDFSAELTVDEDGLVVAYRGVARRIFP